MRTVSYRLGDLARATINIGKVAENEYTRVQFNADQVFAEYPSATPSMAVISPAGVKYPAVVTREGNLIIWDVTDADLTAEGMGELQLTLTENGVVCKSFIARTRIERSIVADGEAPDPVQNWLDEAAEVLEAVEDAIPAGGTQGQVMGKLSDDDYDIGWIDQTGGGGGGGTSNYNDLSNKPQIAGTTLSGNKTLEQLGIASADAVSAKYTKPASGIPASDLASGVIPDVSGFYTKPQSGIPASDLADGVIPDVSGLYTKPSGGIPKSDLASGVQSSLGKADTAYQKPAGGIPAVDIASGVIPDPTDIIDDTAGDGDTNKVWSADKSAEEVSTLSSAIANEVPQTKPSSSAGADLDVCDESGNVIMRLKDGDVQTKNFNSHDPYRVPDYYHTNGYLAGKCDRFNTLARSCPKLMDSFAFCTDQHWTLNAGNSPALLRYVKENTNIDKFFFGGDFCDFVTSEHQPFDGFRQFNEALKEPLYTAMGNHDYMSQYGTEGRLYYTFNSVGRDRVGNMERNYFYIDNPQSMIRYIFLNGFKPENNSWGWGYEQDQLDWLANTALDMESGWGAIIVTHVVKGWNFTSEQVEEPSAATAMLSVLDNYSGDGEVIAVICGHTHFDYSATTTGGIPVLISTSDKNLPWISSDVDKEPWLDDRTTGTIKEQAIDLYIVNREEKKLTRVRIGVPIRYGTDSSSWTEYEDVTISYDRT